MPQLVTEPVEFPGRGKSGAIDWDSLVDGNTYRLVSGEDFTGEQLSIQSSAHQAATRRGLRVRTTTQGRDVIVQFYRPDTGKPRKQRRHARKGR